MIKLQYFKFDYIKFGDYYNNLQYLVIKLQIINNLSKWRVKGNIQSKNLIVILQILCISNYPILTGFPFAFLIEK